MFEPILNHAEAAILRLVGQYANDENLKNLLRALIGPIQEIENALETMNTQRLLDNATGANLDLLGTIIGIARPAGASDEDYRQLLYAQIKINTSEGQPEQVIQTFQLLTNANLVLLSENFPAEVTLSSDHVFPGQDSINSILKILNMVLSAGVRPDGIITFDATEAFAYDGVLPGLGYGDATNPATGGKYATYDTYLVPFAYAGSSVSDGGYGSTTDPLVGGGYVSV